MAATHNDIAAVAAVAAARAAARYELLTPERKTAVAAVTGFHTNLNFVDEQGSASRGPVSPSANRLSRSRCFDLDADELSEPAAIAKLDDAGYLREQRVVLAASDVDAGFVAGAALPHDDRAAGHQLSTKCLDAQPLRVRVAAVLRTA